MTELRSFDLADRAYTTPSDLWERPRKILNNQGYSYMLRGDLVNARRKFLKAYEREPGNPTIANNLQLLNSNSRFISGLLHNKPDGAARCRCPMSCW